MHEVRHNPTQNEAVGATNASGGGRAPTAIILGKNDDVMHEYYERRML